MAISVYACAICLIIEFDFDELRVGLVAGGVQGLRLTNQLFQKGLGRVHEIGVAEQLPNAGSDRGAGCLLLRAAGKSAS
jgi:hypothetical protein